MDRLPKELREFALFWWNHGFKLFVLICLALLGARGCDLRSTVDFSDERLDYLNAACFGTNSIGDVYIYGQRDLPYLPEGDADGEGISAVEAKEAFSPNAAAPIGPFPIVLTTGRVGAWRTVQLEEYTHVDNPGAGPQIETDLRTHEDSRRTLRRVRLRVEHDAPDSGAALEFPKAAIGHLVQMLARLYGVGAVPQAAMPGGWIADQIAREGTYNEVMYGDSWELKIEKASVTLTIED